MQILIGIVALPGTTLIFIPGAILWLTAAESAAATPPGPAQAAFWISVLLAGFGLLLVLWTAGLFKSVGRGTPAPWDPPTQLVVAGPYRYMRNPMITGVLLILAGEAVFFGSWPLVGWLLVFFFIHLVYLVRVEEPGLERRYGEDYQTYRAHVPRWIPRPRPWDGT